jgi:hypothetical protein
MEMAAYLRLSSFFPCMASLLGLRLNSCFFGISIRWELRYISLSILSNLSTVG